VRQRATSRTFDLTGRLRKVHEPTVILHGKRDQLTPLALAQETRTGIPSARLQIFVGGHLFCLTRQRASLDAVSAFL
jgi:pimeloyl-ACP methyl ester carboxylesterase